MQPTCLRGSPRSLLLPPVWLPQLQEEVYEEAAKYGNVSGVYVAIPTAQVQDLMPGRCYIKYGSVEDAKKGGWGAAGWAQLRLARGGKAAVLSCAAAQAQAGIAWECSWWPVRHSWRAPHPPAAPPLHPAGHAVFHGRTLDGNVIKASYVPEDEYSRAAAGEWVSKARCEGGAGQCRVE